MKTFNCDVCGYSRLSQPPWGDDGKTPTYDICPCCGVEFGYEDCTQKSKDSFREKWLNNGAKWFDESKKPQNWDLEEQFRNITKER